MIQHQMLLDHPHRLFHCQTLLELEYPSHPSTFKSIPRIRYFRDDLGRASQMFERLSEECVDTIRCGIEGCVRGEDGDATRSQAKEGGLEWV